MTLYEIDNAIMDAGHVDEETGEFIIDADVLAALQIEREKKVEGILCWIKNLKAENTALRTEEINLASRRKVNENKISSLERYAQFILGGNKFKTAKCSASYRTSTAVVVDEEHLAKKYMKVSYSPDKVALKELLKAGKKIRGAVLETKSNLVIK